MTPCLRYRICKKARIFKCYVKGVFHWIATKKWEPHEWVPITTSSLRPIYHTMTDNFPIAMEEIQYTTNLCSKCGTIGESKEDPHRIIFPIPLDYKEDN